MLNVAMLRSMQKQDADDRVFVFADPAVKFASNLFLMMSDTICEHWRCWICKDLAERFQEAQMLCSWHDQQSCSAASHRRRFRAS